MAVYLSFEKVRETAAEVTYTIAGDQEATLVLDATDPTAEPISGAALGTNLSLVASKIMHLRRTQETWPEKGALES